MLTTKYREFQKQLEILSNEIYKELESYSTGQQERFYEIYYQYTKDDVYIELSFGYEGDWTISFPNDEDGSREIHGNSDDSRCTALEILNKTYVFK